MFLIFFGTGFEVFKVMRIHNAISVRTSHCVVPTCECFEGSLSACLHRLSRDEGSTLRP